MKFGNIFFLTFFSIITFAAQCMDSEDPFEQELLPAYLELKQKFPEIYQKLKQDLLDTKLFNAIEWDATEFYFLNQLDDVKKYIRYGANVNAKDNKKRSPLYQAIDYNQSEILKYLISKGASLKKEDNLGMTPFRWATWLGCHLHADRIEMIRYFIQNGSCIDEVLGKDEHTPLHSAACNDNFKQTKFFVENGANIDAQTQDGETPLDLAIHRNNLYANVNYHATGNYQKIISYLQNAQSYFDKGIKVVPTQQIDPLTIPNYFALAVIKENLKDIKEIFLTTIKDGATPNLRHFIQLAGRLEKENSEHELISLYLKAGGQPQTQKERIMLKQFQLNKKRNDFGDVIINLNF